MKVPNLSRRSKCDYSGVSANFAKTAYDQLIQKIVFFLIDILIIKIGWESIQRPRILWLKVLKTFILVCQARVHGESSVETNNCSVLRLLTILHTVLKYLHSQFHFNLMSTSSITAHFCSKVCAAMLAVDSGVLSTIRSATLPGTSLEVSDWLPALGGMVRVTCHTEISQNTVTQAYS